MYAEHVKYGGKRLIKCLKRLFSLILLHEYIPLHFKQGIIVPVPKGNKNKSLQDNYRGITLISVLAKVFEKCFMKRLESWNNDNHVINDLQGATIAKCSSLHTAWLTKETICCNVEQGKSVYVGLLDIKKAYDTVWQDGLFYKLYKLGLNGKAWRLLRKFYQQFKCQIKLCGGLSVLF